MEMVIDTRGYETHIAFDKSNFGKSIGSKKSILELILENVAIF